jgi:type III restriction enzyme
LTASLLRLDHPQTIEFEIAREIVRALTDAAHPASERLRRESGRALFPQVLRVQLLYWRHGWTSTGCTACEVGLQTYAQRVIGLLICRDHVRMTARARRHCCRD